MQRFRTDICDSAAAKLYAPDFDSARSLFDDACAVNGLETRDYPIGDTRETLRIAVSGPPDARAHLIVLSGLHGIEGQCGSAAQMAMIACLAGYRETVRVIIVHGINPAGMRSNQRVNSDNVDLNRNFLAEYSKLADVSPRMRAVGRLFSSRSLSRLPDVVWFSLLVPYVVGLGGVRVLKEALAGGQFFDAKALFYGGVRLSPELKTLDAALRPLLVDSNPARTIFFDLHSGIGGYGEPSLLANGPTDLPISDVFGRSISDGHKGDQMVYPVRGDVIRGLKAAHGLEGACGVTFELGTGPTLRTLLALRAANNAMVHFPDDPKAVARAKTKMLCAFCPQDDSWRGTYVRQAVALISQALQFLVRRAERDV